MKINKLKIIETTEKTAGVIFILSIYLVIKWSDVPVIDLFIFNNSFFVQNKPVDSMLMGIVTGYFTGYIVYLFTVVIPTKRKIAIVMEQVSNRLIAVCNEFVYVMLLMAKSASDKIVWEKIYNKQKDWDCFDDDYYRVMRKFDVNAPAETIYMKRDTNDEIRKITWFEYLDFKIGTWYKELNDIILLYQTYIPNKMLECVYRIKTSNLFSMVTGTELGLLSYYTDEDGTNYYDHIPLSKFCEQSPGKCSHIFGKENETDNMDILRTCIEDLDKLYNHVIKYIDDERMKPDYCIRKIKNMRKENSETTISE